jgi:hypothetical protein
VDLSLLFLPNIIARTFNLNVSQFYVIHLFYTSIQINSLFLHVHYLFNEIGKKGNIKERTIPCSFHRLATLPLSGQKDLTMKVMFNHLSVSI